MIADPPVAVDLGLTDAAQAAQISTELQRLQQLRERQVRVCSVLSASCGWGQVHVVVCNWVHDMIILNTMEARGQSERGPWPHVLWVLAFDVMYCMWGK